MTAVNKHELIIKSMVKSGELPGAFIFDGPPELTGAAARSLARAIACGDLDYKQDNGEACGVCGACIKSGRDMHPDIIVAEPEGNGAQSFHVDKVREIIGGLYLSPNEGSKKIYIIKGMQGMTQQGQNALLKSLEEPPPFAVFIITAESLDLILETVKSRAAKFSLRDDGAAGGAPDRHEPIIKNILGKSPDRLAVYQDMLKSLDKSGALDFYYNLENAARDVLVAKIFSGDMGGARFLYFDSPEILKKYAGDYSANKILELCAKIREYKSDLEHNANMRLNLSSFFSEI